MKAEKVIHQYQNYLGSGIKPANFDEFWDKQLEELERLPLDYELERVEIPSRVADFYNLYFIGVEGARVRCQYVCPKQVNGKIPGMLMFHGYHGDSGDFGDKVSWAAEGFSVLAMDCRGQGGLSENNSKVKGTTMKGLIIRGVEEGPESLYFRSVFLDTVQAARILMSMDEVNEEEIYIQGASQGGALSLICAALEPRVKKVVAQYPFLSDYRKAFEFNITSSAYEELHYWFRFRDPMHEREDEFFNTLEYIDLQHFAPRIKAEVKWAIALEDDVCYPAQQFAVYNQITSPKEMIIFPEYGHEYLPKLGDRVKGFLLYE
ncbi:MULTISPECIES: alpha/beta fold hydrolase [unclassified Bacillus (in: firmicutes)]|uniref:acetylxylan esterase n=1 Tax=unclassified Bacillus (in: firmicutes) TaxID=185979 RepID=UPI00080AC343|nr:MULTISPECIES: alpha/beta fold hydrolase [unclassified Bacillus (in: firmicutes)]OCA86218.1 acetylesterase [Bacillus sp. FJAT-27986]